MTETNVPKILPVGGWRKKSSGWWGIWLLIATEASLFGYLLLCYYYLWSQTKRSWPPDGLPNLTLPSINTALLLSSSGFVYLAERAVRKNKKWISVFWFVIAIAAGMAFVAVQAKEWLDKDYTITTHLYGSLYYTITGFHMLHVVAGLIILSVLLLWTALGYYDERRYEAVSIGGLYWHFVDVVWLFIFTSFFLAPYF